MSGTRAISTTPRCELTSSFFFLQGKAPKEIHAILRETLGGNAPSYATVKNWVAQFKRGDFSTCDASRPGWPKTVTTPEITDQIHELILGDRRISAKSIAEQLGISCGRVGSITHEDSDMWMLSTKWAPKCLNMDQKRQWCQLSEQVLEFFGVIQMISCHNWWPWTKPGYITMTRRQSNNQWSGGIAAHPTPKNSECKNSLEKFSPRFFGIKTASSSLIIFQRAKLLTRSITHLCWCNWRIFWRKNAAGGSPRRSCSCTTMPWLTGHLQPYLGFHCLDHPPYSPDLAPLDYHLFPGLKKQLKGHHFSSDAEVIPAVETHWMDKLLNFFFEWLAKVRATG